MATKIYVDTTGELVIEGTNRRKIPAFTELERLEVDDESLIIIYGSTGRGVLAQTIYSNLQDSGGTPYASFAALTLALDSFFDDVA